MPHNSASALFPSNPPDEAEMNRMGLKFRNEPLLTIASLEVVEEVQVRGITDRADPKTVNRYAELMRAGVTMKPIIVAELRVNGRTVVTKVDAHHRVAAAEKAGRQTLPAYVIMGAAPAILKAFALMKNREHGKLLSDAETQVALGDLADAGMSIERIVQITALSRGTVDRAISAHNFARRVRQVGLPQDADQERNLNTLGVTARARLARIPHDNVFTEATRLILDAGLSGEEINGVVKAVTSTKTDDDALKMIEAEREIRSDQITLVKAGFVNPRPSYPQQFNMHARALLKLNPKDVVDYNPTTQDASVATATALFDFAYKVTQMYQGVIGNDSADPSDDPDPAPDGDAGTYMITAEDVFGSDDSEIDGDSAASQAAD